MQQIRISNDEICQTIDRIVRYRKNYPQDIFFGEIDIAKLQQVRPDGEFQMFYGNDSQTPGNEENWKETILPILQAFYAGLCEVTSITAIGIHFETDPYPEAA